MDLLGRVIVLLFILYQGKTKAQFTFNSKPQDDVYVVAGKTLRLNVTFTYTGSLNLTLTWSFDGKTLVQKVGNGKPVSLLPGRADIEGQGSLVLKNTSLQDKGTYRFSWAGSFVGNADFTVIILVQPTATLNVSSRSTVPENSEVYYSCEGKNGVPTSNVSWYKGNTLVVKGKILSFRNIQKDQAGNYICKFQSGILTDETVLEIIVQFKPNSTTLKSSPDIAIITKSVKITCKAKGLPEPTYVIYHNGTKLTDKGEVTINTVKDTHGGEYRCNATNKLGKDSDSYFLKVKDGTGDGDSSGLEGWIIAVIVIGGLLVILAIVFLIGCKCGWETFCCCKGIGECSIFCCCKRNGGCSIIRCSKGNGVSSIE